MAKKLTKDYSKNVKLKNDVNHLSVVHCDYCNKTSVILTDGTEIKGCPYCLLDGEIIMPLETIEFDVNSKAYYLISKLIDEVK